MRLPLHSLFLAPALLAAAAVTPQPASAAVLHVPFAFAVAGKILPAGDYKVDRTLNGGAVALSSIDAREHFTWILTPGDPDPGSTAVTMRFDATETGYALRSIQYNALITPRLDKKSRQNEDRPVHVIRGM